MADRGSSIAAHMATAAAKLRDRFEAALLMQHVLGRDRAWLMAHGDDVLDAEHGEQYARLVARRAAGEPVAYLTGTRGFWTFDLAVTPAVLIPRPETELLVELALTRLPADVAWMIADLGTGSGAIALAIASERPRAQVVATDASSEALEVARANADRLGVDNVRFARGDWFDALEGARLDMLVSNPPYIAAGDEHLARGDLLHEPPAALASGADGLDAIRTIVAGAGEYLAPGGWLLFEHGHDQGEAVRELLVTAGFEGVFTERDLEQRERVSGGRRTA